MSNKQYISRIQNKHDIEANWIKAVNFIPLKGEIIIYDVDENHSYPRVKIGDEVNTITNLPFLSNEERINELIIEHIQAIDVSGLDLDPDETINIIKQTDGALSVTKQAIKIAASQVADFDAAVGELIPDKPGISASATDDDVVILTLNANYDASTDKYLITADSKHLEAFGNTYNSANATTSIGAGESKTIKIPQLSVDKYGHTVAATDESVTITIPSIPSSVSSAIQSVSASGDGVITLNAEKTGTSVAITGAHSKEGVAYTDNNTATSISGYGATATIKIPQIQSDAYGHVVSHSEDEVTITMPSAQTIPDLTDGGVSSTGNTISLSHEDSFTVLTDVDVNGHTVTPRSTIYTLPKVAVTNETASNASGTSFTYTESVQEKNGDISTTRKKLTTKTAYSTTNPLATIQDIVDKFSTIDGAMEFKGVKSEIPTDNSSFNKGDVIIVGKIEYVYDGTNWVIIGNEDIDTEYIQELINQGLLTLNSTDSSQDGYYVSGVSLVNGGVQINETALPNHFSSIKVGDKTLSPDSLSDTLTLTQGNNITLVGDEANDKITISAKDTTYTAGSGLKLTGTEFNHDNTVTAKTSYPNSSTSLKPSHGGTFKVRDVKYDTEGHITSSQDVTVTLPSETTLVDGGVSPTGTTTNLEHEDTFTVLTDVDVDGHTVTPRSTKFKLPKPTMDIYYIEGSGSSTGKWKGSHERITQYTPGLTIAYKLDAAGSSSAVTLDINGLGAKTVYRNASTNIATAYPVGSVVLFIYTEDSGVGVWKAADYDANTTYTNVKLGHGYATSSTAADTTAKTASLSSYLLTTGGIVAVKFTEGNTATSMTLNVNSKGAKTVYLNGSSTIPNNIIAAGDIVTFIYSSQYHIISIQKDSQTIGLTGAVTGEYTGSLEANTISIATSIANGTSTIDNDKKLEYVESIGSTGAVRKYVPTKSAVTDTNPLMTQTDVTSAVNTGISDLATIMRFRGIVTDNPETYADKVLTLKAGGTLTPVTGDVVIYETNRNEWIYDGSKWVELGDERIDEDKIQSIVNDAIGTLDKADTAVDGQYVSAVSETNGIISVTHADFPIAGAGTTGVVKGFHRTSGTATGTKTTNATNAPAVNARSTTSGRYYGVETDATGAMYVNVPWANGDTKVKQNPKTTDGEFPILVRGTSPGTDATTAEATFRVLTTLNPSNGVITTNNGSTSTASYGPEEITLTDSTGTITIGSHDNQLLVSGGIDLNITRIQPIIENEASKGLKVDGSKILTHATGAGNNKKPVYVADAYGTLAECAYTLGAACAKGVTDSSTASAISSTGTNLVTERDVYHGLPKINGVHTYDSSKNIYAPTTVGTSGQILKSNGSGAPVWIDGANLIAPKKITLVATAGQTSFSIPFEYDSLSSNLTVYFNGILMKETDNYTVNTTNNTVNLAGFSAEAGDVVTIMGLLGAQSIDFGQELIDVINEINEVVEQAKQEIDNKVNNAFTQIDVKIDEVEAFVEQLPDDVSKLMSKNTNNTLDSGYKITLTNVTPSAAGDVTTKQYVDNAISTATSAIISDVFVASPNSPDKGYSGTEATKRRKLLWIDTGTSDPGLKYYNGSSWVTVPVRWS